MRRKRWRRSTEAKPDEIWTLSILHCQGCWCMQSPESLHARCLSCSKLTRNTWAQIGMYRRFCFCADLNGMEVM